MVKTVGESKFLCLQADYSFPLMLYTLVQAYSFYWIFENIAPITFVHWGMAKKRSLSAP